MLAGGSRSTPYNLTLTIVKEYLAIIHTKRQCTEESKKDIGEPS